MFEIVFSDHARKKIKERQIFTQVGDTYKFLSEKLINSYVLKDSPRYLMKRFFKGIFNPRAFSSYSSIKSDKGIIFVCVIDKGKVLVVTAYRGKPSKYLKLTKKHIITYVKENCLQI